MKQLIAGMNFWRILKLQILSITRPNDLVHDLTPPVQTVACDVLLVVVPVLPEQTLARVALRLNEADFSCVAQPWTQRTADAHL